MAQGNVTVYGAHHAASALRVIRDTPNGWKESGGGAGIRVFARDGDQREAREAEEWRRRRAERDPGEDDSGGDALAWHPRPM
jgi:hypothetical protein